VVAAYGSLWSDIFTQELTTWFYDYKKEAENGIVIKRRIKKLAKQSLSRRSFF